MQYSVTELFDCRVCMYVRMYVGTYVRTYVCIYVCMYVRMHACMQACMHACFVELELLLDTRGVEVQDAVDLLELCYIERWGSNL